MVEDEDIIYIDKKTRKRKINGEWKLEKKDPIYGVWVIHPIQFWKDFNMEDTMRELDEEQEKDRLKMFKKEAAEEFLKEDVARYDENAKFVKVKKVIDVTMPFHFRENKIELVFDGKLGDKNGRYIAGCDSYSGDFYEPPSEECWFEDLHETLKYKEDFVKKATTPKRVFTGREIINEHGVKIKEELPLHKASPEQITNEKRRLERIYQGDIKRLEYLRRFL